MSRLARGMIRPSKRTLLWGALIVNAELLITLAYYAVTSVPGTLRYALLTLYPWVWLNASLWVYVRVRAPDAPTHRRVLAGTLAGGYFLLLCYVGGVLLPGIGDRATGLRLVGLTLPPGFAPALLYSGQAVVLNLIPFKLVGYLTLAYLIYGTVLDVSGSAVAGVVGLFSCVSCSLPIIAAIVSGIAGSGTAIATAATGQSYGLSTVVFLFTVAVLVWQPDWSDLARLRALAQG
ncbi:DUF7546 family protein [Natronomonas sp. EA1]|uniref:DUF7546 family protein n=1 Tax=Natronomonas sp. EA1 TaxID=3421655 RepID=UPI003EBE4B59